MLGIALTAAFAASSAQAGAAPAYPLEAVLDAGREFCAAVPTAADVGRGRAPAGWTAFSPPQGSAFASYVTPRVRGFGEGIEIQWRTLRAVRAGRTLYALVVTMQMDDLPSGSSCEVKDFEARLPLDRERFLRWGGRTPSITRDMAQDVAAITGTAPSAADDAASLYALSWVPGLNPRHSMSEVGLVGAELTYLAISEPETQ